MFVYILELLNGKGNLAFFDLKVGGCKANNAQKEKRHLARKRSCASKQEREREAAKAAKLPAHQRQCEACGRKFESRKTAKKHKCPKSKVVRVPREAASGQASQATPTAKADKPPALLTPHAPTTPSNNDGRPAVTGDSQAPPFQSFTIQNTRTGERVEVLTVHEAERFRGRPTGSLWQPG